MFFTGVFFPTSFELPTATRKNGEGLHPRINESLYPPRSVLLDKPLLVWPKVKSVLRFFVVGEKENNNSKAAISTEGKQNKPDKHKCKMEIYILWPNHKVLHDILGPPNITHDGNLGFAMTVVFQKHKNVPNLAMKPSQTKTTCIFTYYYIFMFELFLKKVNLQLHVKPRNCKLSFVKLAIQTATF